MLEVTLYGNNEMRVIEARARCTDCTNDKASTQLDGDPQTMINLCINALEECGHV